MMTSSNGNIFRVTGPFMRGIHRWPVDSLTKASDEELWCFPAHEQTVEQTIGTPIIWDAIAFIMRHCNVKSHWPITPIITDEPYKILDRDIGARRCRQPIFSVPLSSEFQHCQNTRWILHVTFTFDRCCHSSVAVTPEKYQWVQRM